MTRPDRHEWFMGFARQAALRSTCPSAQVGAAIVRDDDLIVVGYNGAPRGMVHCSDIGCVAVESRLVPTDYHTYRATREYSRHVHAELNAILHCARTGRSTEGCDIYVTMPPCLDCAKAIIQAGIRALYLDPDLFTQGWYDDVGRFLSDGRVPIASYRVEDHHTGANFDGYTASDIQRAFREFGASLGR